MGGGVVVGPVVTGGVVVGGTVVGGMGALPFPTLVVIGPFSMYTPEKYQSSALGPFTILNTPTCQSSEFVDGDVAMFCTTFVSGAEPVEAHRPTVPPLKSMS